MTNNQITQIKRFTKNIIFCFDSDSAGQQALKRASEIALKNDMTVKVIEIPEKYGKDPDECINNDLHTWIGCIKNAVPLFPYFFKKELHTNDNIKEKSAKIEFLISLIGSIDNKIEQVHWLEELSAFSNTHIALLQEKLAAQKKENTGEERIPKPDSRAFDTESDALLERFFSIIIHNPHLFKQAVKDIDPEMIKHSNFKNLYKNLIIYYTKNNQELPLNEKGYFKYEYFCDWMLKEEGNTNKEEISKIFNKLYLLACEYFADFDLKLLQKEFFYIYKKLKNNHIKEQIDILSKSIKSETDKLKIERMSKQFNELISQYIK